MNLLLYRFGGGLRCMLEGTSLCSIKHNMVLMNFCCGSAKMACLLKSIISCWHYFNWIQFYLHSIATIVPSSIILKGRSAQVSYINFSYYPSYYLSGFHSFLLSWFPPPKADGCTFLSLVLPDASSCYKMELFLPTVAMCLLRVGHLIVKVFSVLM